MKIREIAVLPEARKITLVVEMPDPDRFLTSQVPHIPRLLFRILPHMEQHKCYNDHDLAFRDECRQTEIPHLFEHLIIELQAQAEPTEVLRGETEWNWQIDPRGYFHVTVDYQNELLAVAAIRLAEKILASLDRRYIHPIDMDAEMQRLRELARLSRELASWQMPTPKTSKKAAPRTWDTVSFGAVA